jgi:shikimate dehydrogenase
MAENMALLGRGIQHSLSPRMWEGLFAATSSGGTYKLRDVEEAGLGVALDDLRSGVVTTFHVTMPYKSWAYRVAEQHEDSTVSLTRVVNGLVMKDGLIEGSNTDVKAARILLSELPKPPERVLVIGAGATAASLVCAVNEVASSVVIVNRTDDTSRALADRDWTSRTEAGLWSDRESHAQDADLIVNTAPFGLTIDATPIALWPNDALLYDLIYGPNYTPLQLRSASAGARVVDGLAHLQAHVEACLQAGNLETPDAELLENIMYKAAGRRPARWDLLDDFEKKEAPRT